MHTQEMEMKTDRELLGLAAKAAGLRLEWDGPPDQWRPMHYEGKTYCAWNPLADDGDCARLEVACELQVDIGDIGVVSERLDGEACVEKYADHSGDKNKTRRIASVRAAAAIGEGME